MLAITLAVMSHYDEFFHILANIIDFDWNWEYDTGFTIPMIAALKENMEFIKFLIKQKNIDWNLKNRTGLNILSLALKYLSSDLIMMIINVRNLEVNIEDLSSQKVLARAIKECKSYVSKMMSRKSTDREVTKTPLIFALENSLNKNIVKILVSGATSQEIVDLVLYSRFSISKTFMDGNESKRLKLDTKC